LLRGDRAAIPKGDDMAKNDRDLFDRLRSAGLRKQVARTLSGIGDDAGKKAVRAARNAATELRSLADDIERRLPSLPAVSIGSSAPARRTATRKPAARKPAARRSTARKPAARKPAARTTAARTTSARQPAARAASPSTTGRRAPRGANKAKILRSLRSGPKTASEIAKQTGIGVGTVGSTLTKMTGTGEVKKAARGYSLP
jgi:hypothetical protein